MKVWVVGQWDDFDIYEDESEAEKAVEALQPDLMLRAISGVWMAEHEVLKKFKAKS